MKLPSLIFAGIVAGLGLAPASAAEALLPLHVLYVGNAKSPRAEHFETFLKKHFAQVELADRVGFDPVRARDADVVLFDWSQADSRLPETALPLGRLDQWSKPTVLLNHSGLLVAEHWHVVGDFG